MKTPFDAAWDVLKATLPMKPKTMQYETDPKRTRRYEQTGGIARRGRERMMDDFPERFNDPMEEDDVMDDELGLYDEYTEGLNRRSHPTRSPGTASDFGKYPFWIGEGTHPDGGEMSYDEEGEPNRFSFGEQEPRTIESEYTKQMMRRLLGE
tara:strand:- start:418 stop:873 length:456 start_codon:yes stop_codon:yes gene_type:complete